MLDEIKKLRDVIKDELKGVVSVDKLEKFRLTHLVKKGTLTALTERFKEIPAEMKPVVGKELNVLRQYVKQEFARLQEHLATQEEHSTALDTSLPGQPSFRGSIHPVQQMMEEMVSIFVQMGFAVAGGPEIEDDYHNFAALNFPPDHPARDMQDTFFVKDKQEEKVLLRTHTSPVQIRLMQSRKPPLRSIVPGKVYRNEAIDASHLAEFHQIEGLYVDKNVSFAELKGTITTFLGRLFADQKDAKFRFRPSFFPFTEPSAEIDMYFSHGKNAGWRELAGCGMVHPNVLSECGIDPEEYSGFAFGLGVERFTMLKTGIDDIRLLYENDLRVLHQFA